MRISHCPQCGYPNYDGSNCPDCGYKPPSQGRPIDVTPAKVLAAGPSSERKPQVLRPKVDAKAIDPTAHGRHASQTVRGPRS